MLNWTCEKFFFFFFLFSTSNLVKRVSTMSERCSTYRTISAIYIPFRKCYSTLFPFSVLFLSSHFPVTFFIVSVGFRVPQHKYLSVLQNIWKKQEKMYVRSYKIISEDVHYMIIYILWGGTFEIVKELYKKRNQTKLRSIKKFWGRAFLKIYKWCVLFIGRETLVNQCNIVTCRCLQNRVFFCRCIIEDEMKFFFLLDSFWWNRNEYLLIVYFILVVEIQYRLRGISWNVFSS